MTYDVVAESSIIAIVTHRGGIASTFAHNHLIAAADYTVTLTLDSSELEGTRFSIQLPVPSLIVDDSDVREQWSERIDELGIENHIGSPSDKDRKKIRKKMLSRNQLAADDFDSIYASVAELHESQIDFECHGQTMIATMEVVIKGNADRVEFQTCITVVDDSVRIEAHGRALFTQFGIKPFSGFLGTVKNKNEFDFYVNLVAVKKSERNE